MRLAVIPPAQHLVDFCERDGGAVQLCLSSWLLESQLYYSFYTSRRRAKDYVILDNSAHEHGSGDSAQTLLNLIYTVEPDEVVLPDRLFFGSDTLIRSMEAVEVFQSRFPEVHLMGVPQGRTDLEFYTCLDGLLELPIRTVGISKDYEVWPGGLSKIVSAIPSKYQIHLLGWPRSLGDPLNVEEDHPGRVRSIDTAKGVVYGMGGVWFPGDCEDFETPYPRRTDNYLEAVLDHKQVRASHYNISQMRRWVNDTETSVSDLSTRKP